MRNNLLVLLIGGASLLLGFEVHAEACDLQDSVRSCGAKLLRQLEAQNPSKDSLEAAAKNELGRVNTGSASATNPSPTSAFTDFFSLLNVGAQGDQDDDTADDAIGFELNECGVSLHSGLKCQLRGRLGDPQIFEPLVNALPESTREARKEELEQSLDPTDSFALGLFFNVESKTLGRVPDFTDDGVFAAIRQLAAARVQRQRQESARAGAEWNQFLESMLTCEEKPPERTSPAETASEKECRELREKLEDGNTPFAELPDGRNGAVALATYLQTATPRLQAVVAAETVLREFHYFDIIKLVNNQPQLNFGIELANRSDLVGPDELRAKISYEIGAYNMNWLRSRCGEAKSDALATCAKAVLDDPETRSRLDSSNRLTLTLEYVRQKHYVATLPQDDIAIDLPSQRSWVGSVAWGRYLSSTSPDGRATRFDLVGAYEDVSSDPQRQDRGTATLTFSQRLTNGLIANLGIVYATKPEFRGEVNQEWSSRLGFNYKFGRD